MLDIKKFQDKNGKLSTSKIRKISASEKAIICSLNPVLSNSSSIPEHLYWIAHGLSDYPKACLHCGNKIRQFYSYSRGYAHDYCTTACARSSSAAEIKKKNTIKNRYGVDSIWEINEVVERRNRTCRIRYGATSSMHLARDAALEINHVQHVSEIPGVLRKRLHTIKIIEADKLIDRLGEHFDIDKADYISSKDVIAFTCRRCDAKGLAKPRKISCGFCDKLDARSSIENSILSKIREHTLEVCIQNKKHAATGYYPDFYFPDKNLIIELDGNYWHAQGRGGDHLKSFRKKKAYTTANINSMFFFEDECIKKPEIVVNLILAKMGMFENKIRASKCSLAEISAAECQVFLDSNHLQGNIPSAFRFGLYYANELVAVATFGKCRFSKHAEYELLRLAFSKRTKIYGGASKLIKHAMSVIGIQSLISYSDRRFSNGAVYEKTGFSKISTNFPAYFYMHTSDYLTRMSRLKFQKKKLIKMGGVEALSEWENAQLLKLDRIYDCGSETWLLTL